MKKVRSHEVLGVLQYVPRREVCCVTQHVYKHLHSFSNWAMIHMHFCVEEGILAGTVRVFVYIPVCSICIGSGFPFFTFLMTISYVVCYTHVRVHAHVPPRMCTCIYMYLHVRELHSLGPCFGDVLPTFSFIHVHCILYMNSWPVVFTMPPFSD